MICKGQLRRGVSEGLRVAKELEESIEGRIVLVIGAGFLGAPGWRVERRQVGAEAATGTGAFVREVAGSVVGAVIRTVVGAVLGAGGEKASERESWSEESVDLVVERCSEAWGQLGWLGCHVE